jgi:feruloyl esterase
VNQADATTIYGGDAPQPPNLWDALVKWVEEGVAPDYVVASQGANSAHPARSTKVCMYPNERIFNGGDPNSEASYSCQHVTVEPPELREKVRSLLDPS